MNDANQGASGRRRGPEDDPRAGRADADAGRPPLGKGFDPLEGEDGRGAASDAADPALTGADELGALLREALCREIDAVASSDPSLVAADETSRLDAAIALHAALPPQADLDDPAWCAALLAAPALRRDLADVGSALTAIEADPDAGIGAHLRRAALGAFDRAAALPGDLPGKADDPAPTAPRARPVVLRPEREPLVSWLGWRAAAAVVLVALGVTIVAVGGLLHDDVTGNGAGAEAGMRLEHVTEHRLGTRTGYASRQRWIRVGESFAPTADQVVVFGLGEASHVVVGDGDRLRVAAGKAIDARLMARARADLHAAGREIDLAAVLRLEAGEAQLGSEGRRPVLLAVGDEVLLVLRRGKCHVAVDPGAAAAGPGAAIALAQDTDVTVYRAANGDRAARTFELAGPKRILLGAEGPEAFGTPAASLFRDLELFGGSLETARTAERAVRIEATLWRVLRGDAQRADGRFRVGAAGGTAWLSFRPPNTLRGATALRVWLRAAAETRVTVRGAGDLEGMLGTLRLPTDTRQAEPGVETVVVPLPSDWHARLAGGELVVEIAPAPIDGTPGGDRRGYFEGAAFVMGDAASRNSDPEAAR